MQIGKIMVSISTVASAPLCSDRTGANPCGGVSTVASALRMSPHQQYTDECCKDEEAKLRADVEDGVQLLAETLTYTNRGLNRPSARGDELEQGARVDASGLRKHICKHPSGTYMIQSA